MKTHNVMALALATMAGTCFGELPGLPPAAAPVVPPSVSAADPRGGHVPPPVMMAQPGPIRGSLFKQGAAAAVPLGADGQPMDGAHMPVSFIAVQPSQPRRYQKNDLITVIVREDSGSTVNGKGSSNKTQDYDLALQQFIQLAINSSGLPQISTVNNPSNLPEIKFKYNNNRQSDASQERLDTMSARITATIVDVKPNGTMIIEATKQIVIDKEEQYFKLSGTCRVDDIAADNTLLSTQMANLSLSKQTKGEVRDTTKRGWLNKFLDTFTPF